MNSNKKPQTLASKITSPAGLCKIAIIVVGIAVLGVGLYSHFQSVWKSLSFFEGCKHPEAKKCPDIAMEQFYISIIIICFILSVAGMVATMTLDLTSGMFLMIDIGFHFISAILLALAAVLYLISVERINKLEGVKNLEEQQPDVIKFRRIEKLIAVGLTFLQSILYYIAALVIAKQS